MKRYLYKVKRIRNYTIGFPNFAELWAYLELFGHCQVLSSFSFVLWLAFLTKPWKIKKN